VRRVELELDTRQSRFVIDVAPHVDVGAWHDLLRGGEAPAPSLQVVEPGDARATIVVEGTTLPPHVIRRYVDTEVAPVLQRMPGIAVQVCGGATTRLALRLDETRLFAHQLTPDQVGAALRRQGESTQASLGADLAALLKTPLRPGTTGPVVLSDVAIASIEPVPARCRATRDGEHDVVAIQVQTRDPKSLADVVLKLRDLEVRAPRGLHLNVMDAAQSTKDTQARRARSFTIRAFGAAPRDLILRLRRALSGADLLTTYEGPTTPLVSSSAETSPPPPEVEVRVVASGEEVRTPAELVRAMLDAVSQPEVCLDIDHPAGRAWRVWAVGAGAAQHVDPLQRAFAALGATWHAARAHAPRPEVSVSPAPQMNARGRDIASALRFVTLGLDVGSFGTTEARIPAVLVPGDVRKLEDAWVFSSDAARPVPLREVALLRTEDDTLLQRVDGREAVDFCVQRNEGLGAPTSFAERTQAVAAPPGLAFKAEWFVRVANVRP
jgi:hypothetical protein